MKSITCMLTLGVLGLFVTAVAAAEDYSLFESKKYGYALKLPKEFKLEGKEDQTTTWSYQPGASPAGKEAAPAAKEEKKKGLGGLAKGVTGGLMGGAKAKGEAAAPAGASGGQELEPALSIYINWVWMPDVATSTMFETNKKSDLQNIDSPDPTYTDLVVMDKKGGYAIEGGSAYRFKEKDKSDPAEIHRWHIKAFGNKSAYTIGLCGTFQQFEKWSPVYEEVIKSFKLIPLEGNR